MSTAKIAGCTLHLDVETLSAWRDRALSPEGQARVAAHLPDCAACRARLAQYDAVARALRTLAVPEPIGGYGHSPRPWEQETPWARATSGQPRPGGWMTGLGPLAAVLLLALVAAALLRSRGGVPPGGTVVPGMGTLVQFPLPVPGRQPRLIVGGSDGNLWFTENGHLGRITPAGRITEFTLPAGATPSGLTAGPDGALWFTDVAAGRIGRLDPRSGAVREFALPAGTGLVGPIVAGPSGSLWFPAGTGPDSVGVYTAFTIARITPQGVVTAFPLPQSASALQVADLAVGPDGNLWFPIWGIGYDAIGRMSPAGSVALFPTPDFNGEPGQIVAGPDGNLWFAEGNTPVIVGRVTPQGAIAEFVVDPSLSDLPARLSAGPDGNVWFANAGDYQIGYVSPQGKVKRSNLPAGVALGSFVTGPDGDLWGTDAAGDRIVRIELARSG
jgi:virginiamycin B lyase